MGKPSTGGSSFGTGMGGMGNFGNLWGAMGGAMGPMGGAGGGNPGGGSGISGFFTGSQSPMMPGQQYTTAGRFPFGIPQSALTAATASPAFPFGVTNQINNLNGWQTPWNIQNFPSSYTAAPNPADATTNEWGLPTGQYPWSQYLPPIRAAPGGQWAPPASSSMNAFLAPGLGYQGALDLLNQASDAAQAYARSLPPAPADPMGVAGSGPREFWNWASTVPGLNADNSGNLAPGTWTQAGANVLMGLYDPTNMNADVMRQAAALTNNPDYYQWGPSLATPPTPPSLEAQAFVNQTLGHDYFGGVIPQALQHPALPSNPWDTLSNLGFGSPNSGNWLGQTTNQPPVWAGTAPTSQNMWGNFAFGSNPWVMP